jgi:ABC-2 type transport system ATP-binding protein
MPSEPAAVALRDLHKRYGPIQALSGLDLEFPKGRVTGFLGPNGAGKTTTFRALLGLTRPDRGEIEILGRRVPDDLHWITKRVGCIIEEPGLIKAHTGRVNLWIAADTLGFGHERIDEMLDFVGLSDDSDRRVDGYSKGMRQRLALAASMLGDPELLLLDEPLDGLDPAGQHVFRGRLRALAEMGKTVVVSSHALADVEALADEVVVIDRGRLVTQGPLGSLLGGEATRVVVEDAARAVSVLSAAGMASRVDGFGLLVESDGGSEIVRILANAGIYPSEVGPARSTLESVFLGITGGDRL